MGFKPIFEEERIFLQERLGIELPTDCWRNSSKVYLVFTQTVPYLQFKVENGKLMLVKSNADGYKARNKISFLCII